MWLSILRIREVHREDINGVSFLIVRFCEWVLHNHFVPLPSDDVGAKNRFTFLGREDLHDFSFKALWLYLIFVYSGGDYRRHAKLNSRSAGRLGHRLLRRRL